MNLLTEGNAGNGFTAMLLLRRCQQTCCFHTPAAAWHLLLPGTCASQTRLHCRTTAAAAALKLFNCHIPIP
jgi:hypothetical protein